MAAYEEQLAVIESVDAVPVLMASRHLAAAARGPDDYAAVYGRLLPQVKRPAVLHWLGPMFDPALEGYWGSPDLDTAAEALLALIGEHASRVDGVKISLLDAGREIAFRRRLPPGVRLYTGDDFNYPELIRGDAEGTATRSSASSTPSRRPPPRRCGPSTAATPRPTRRSSRRRSRWRATSSRPRPTTTRRAWCSWPG